MRAEEEQLLEDLRREMRENEETLAKLRPKVRAQRVSCCQCDVDASQLIEQETLEEELQTLRQERWQLQQVGELEKLKELVASSAESETVRLLGCLTFHSTVGLTGTWQSTAAQGVTAQAETALLEMMCVQP